MGLDIVELTTESLNRKTLDRRKARPFQVAHIVIHHDSDGSVHNFFSQSKQNVKVLKAELHWLEGSGDSRTNPSVTAKNHNRSLEILHCHLDLR